MNEVIDGILWLTFHFMQLSTIFMMKLDLIMKLDLQRELNKSSYNYENTKKVVQEEECPSSNPF